MNGKNELEVTTNIKSKHNLVMMGTDNGIAIISEEEAEESLRDEAKQFAIAELITRHEQELDGLIEKEIRQLHKCRIIPWGEGKDEKSD